MEYKEYVDNTKADRNEEIKEQNNRCAGQKGQISLAEEAK